MVSNPPAAALPPLFLLPSTSVYSTASFLPNPLIPIDVQHSGQHSLHPHRHQNHQHQPRHHPQHSQDNTLIAPALVNRVRRGRTRVTTSPTTTTARVSRLTRHSSARRQRKLHSPLQSTASSIFGQWDIDIKSEHRPKTRGKSRAAFNGGGGRGGLSTTAPSAVSVQHASPSHAAGEGTVISSSESHTVTTTTSGGNIPTHSSHKGPRRMSSTPSNLASNATTAWTIGQQRAGNGVNVMPPTDSTYVNHTGVAISTEPVQMSTYLTPKSNNDQSTSSPFSARSTFMRAIGKFRNKHQQKRASAASSANQPPSTTSSFVLPPLKFDQSAPVSSDKSSTSAPYSGHHSEAGTVSMISYVGSTQTRDGPSLELHDIDMEDSQSPSISTGSMAPPSRVRVEENRASPATSLRTKFRNKVNSTLASIKSSSTTSKDKHRFATSSQQSSPTTLPSAYGSSEVSPTTMGSFTSHYDSSPSPTSPLHRNLTKQQQPDQQQQQHQEQQQSSKPFWTFPRSKPENNNTPSKPTLPWGETPRPNSYSGHSETVNQAGQDTVMVSPELGPMEDQAIAQVLNLDTKTSGVTQEEQDESDELIDIIVPGDYEDYTPFAELSLTKRKKLEAAAAAAAARREASSLTGSSLSTPKKPHAMKRLLESGKKKGQQVLPGKGSNVSSTYERSESLNKDATGSQLRPKNSKKRPKDQDSIEQKQGQEPNKMVKGNSEEPSEWRRALIKSLHLGRGSGSNQQAKRKAKEETLQAQDVQLTTALNAQQPHHQLQEQQQGADAKADSTASQTPLESGEQEVRPQRSSSIHSIRSRSLTTSSHAALLATTMPKPRGPGLRRETLEMAMRRRRRSSAARSGFLDAGDVPPMPMPGLSRASLFDVDNASTSNITHTFTSFTFELADLYAHDVVNNSATPGLFNFKHPPQSRQFISEEVSHQMDTSQEFRGFDSDGDALSGYTGDADISMEESFIRPRSSISASSVTAASKQPRDGRDLKEKSRDSAVVMTMIPPGPVTTTESPAVGSQRRKLSVIDGESDTVPDLPVLTIRTRDLNRSSGDVTGLVSGGGHRTSGSYSRSPGHSNDPASVNTSPRSPPRRSSGNAVSPTLSRKPSRNLVSAYNAGASPGAASQASKGETPSASVLSMEEVVSWKPRNILQQQQNTSPTSTVTTRPPVPALDTTAKPVLTTRGSELSSSTTLIPSSRTPYSATGSGLSLTSPVSGGGGGGGGGIGRQQGYGRNSMEPLPLLQTQQQHHTRQPSVPQHSQHQQQLSTDTMVPNHLKNFSTASTLSASSAYSAQTLTSQSGLSTASHHPHVLLQQQQQQQQQSKQKTVEFDASEKFPTTPVDLKTMDFEALLQMAEQEQRKGWEELREQKKRNQAGGEGTSGEPFLDNTYSGKHGSNISSSTASPQLQQQRQQQQQQQQHRQMPLSTLSQGLNVTKNKSQASSAPNLDALDRQEQQQQQQHQSRAIHNSNSVHASSQKGSSGIHQLHTSNNNNNNNKHPGAVNRSLPKPASHHSSGRVANAQNVAFDINTAAEGGGHHGGRSSQARSKRVMKKKMSVIKLSGAVQGGRGHDGVIRVSVSSSGDPNQWRST
ncbi:hypothetical protein BGZ94_009920 [Podila epigama]|nr:hypothetical protein BGZ94_009920 [Podila epigama]